MTRIRSDPGSGLDRSRSFFFFFPVLRTGEKGKRSFGAVHQPSDLQVVTLRFFQTTALLGKKAKVKDVTDDN